MAPPFKEAFFDIMYGTGISHEGELVDLGVDYGIINKSGAWFSYGEERLGQGRENVKTLLSSNPALAAEIEAKIFEAVKNGVTVEPKKKASKSAGKGAKAKLDIAVDEDDED